MNNRHSSYNQGVSSDALAELAAKPLAERERELWSASAEYMSGKMTREELEEIERPYRCLDYGVPADPSPSSSNIDQQSSLLGSLFHFFKS